MELDSVWRSREVNINGVPLEWRGTTTWVESPNVAIGVQNDRDYLYLCVSSPVRDVAAQIALRGFTVWLDPEGKKNKTFGIRCPVGPSAGTIDPRELGEVARDQARFMEMIAGRLNGAGNVLEILGSERDSTVRLTVGEARGIEISLGYYDGRVVYELKVPFRCDEEHPYAIGSDGRGRIGVGFQTPEIDRQEMGAPMGGGGSGGGVRGSPQPNDGMRRSGPPGGGPGAMLVPIDIWAKIKLADAGVPQGEGADPSE